MNTMLREASKRSIPMPNNIDQIKNMMNTVRYAGNPQAMLNSMVMNNPKLKEVMDYIGQNGGDPRAAYYKMAGEKNVDPEQILNMLR